MKTWPATLPQKLTVDSYEEQLIENAVVTEMDAGPVFRRLRYTMQPRVIAGSVVMDKDQIQTLRGFWKDDIHYGVSDFEWTGMIEDGVKYTVYLDAADTPALEPLGGGYWSVTMNIRITKQEDV